MRCECIVFTRIIRCGFIILTTEITVSILKITFDKREKETAAVTVFPCDWITNELIIQSWAVLDPSTVRLLFQLLLITVLDSY